MRELENEEGLRGSEDIGKKRKEELKWKVKNKL